VRVLVSPGSSHANVRATAHHTKALPGSKESTMKRPALQIVAYVLGIVVVATTGVAQTGPKQVRPRPNANLYPLNERTLGSQLFVRKPGTQKPPATSQQTGSDGARIMPVAPRTRARPFDSGQRTVSPGNRLQSMPMPFRTPLPVAPRLAEAPPRVATAPAPMERDGSPMPIVRRGGGLVGRSPKRLVAVLGDLRCLDVTDGGLIEAGNDQLRVAVGALVGYTDGTYRAFGDYLSYGAEYGFNNVFDGPGHYWREGPFLDHPIMTLNEVHPSSVLFEAATPGKRVSYVRLAVSLYEWDTPDREFGPEVDRTATVPRSEFAGAGDPVMSRVLNAHDWSLYDVGAGHRRGLTSGELAQGRDVSDFGKMLERHAMLDMDGTNLVTNESDRIGIAEWSITNLEFADVLINALSITGRAPDGPSLRRYRDSVGGTPAWVRQFHARGDDSHYVGEVWFLLIDDAAFETLYLPHFRPMGDALPRPG
jgi:hypothetical protein